MLDPTLQAYVSPQQRQSIQAELQIGERILWIGRPRAWQAALKSAPIILFGIPWTGFALFWTYAAAGFRIPDPRQGMFFFFPLFGVPFILVGLAMLSSPFWALRKARQTFYVITDRRALLIEGGSKTTVRSIEPERFKDLVRHQRADGSGDIVLQRQVFRDSDGDQQTFEIGFYGIEKVREVEKLLRKVAARRGESRVAVSA